jgi:hypothetical protein
MALWQKLKRIASAAKARTKAAIRFLLPILGKIAGNRPMILRSAFAKNFGTIVISLFVNRVLLLKISKN